MRQIIIIRIIPTIVSFRKVEERGTKEKEKRKEKKRKRTEGEGSESLIEFLKSSNSDSNFSRGENDSRVNLAD